MESYDSLVVGKANLVQGTPGEGGIHLVTLCDSFPGGQSGKIMGDHMCSESPPKLAGGDPPWKNRIPPAPEVNLCLEFACAYVLWSVLLLNKPALSAINTVC